MVLNSAPIEMRPILIKGSYRGGEIQVSPWLIISHILKKELAFLNSMPAKLAAKQSVHASPINIDCRRDFWEIFKIRLTDLGDGFGYSQNSVQSNLEFLV